MVSPQPIWLHNPLQGRRRGRVALGLALVVALAFALASAPGAALAEQPMSEPLTVYYVRSLPTDMGLVPVNVPAPEGTAPERAALDLLIKGPPAGSGLTGLIPPQTRLLSLTIADGLATVDFSQEIMTGSWGSTGEALCLGSIVNTLTGFIHIDRVWILVEGQAPGSLGGHVDITEPLKYNPAALALPLTDVTGHWAAGHIHAMYLAGIVSGYPEGDYRPERHVTREEFAKLVVLTAGIAPIYPEQASFADVGKDRWSYGVIEAAVAAGILRPSDYGANLRPADLLGRREMATLLVRAAGEEALATSLTGAELPFTDLETQPGWARGYIAAATQLGLMNGFPDGTFRPAALTKRGEVATVLGRYLKIGEKEIRVVYPSEGSQVKAGDQVLVLGVARVFEATLQVRVRDGAGKAVAQTYTMTTAGAPEWGVYAAMLPAPAAPGEFTVEAYELSAMDGSEINVVERHMVKLP